jgi:hypothetical protein
MVVCKVPIWTAVRHLSRRARKVSADRPGLAHFLPATFMPIPPLCFCHLVPVSGEYYPGSTFAARVPIAAATLASANVSPSEAASPRAAAAATAAADAATASASPTEAAAATFAATAVAIAAAAATAVAADAAAAAAATAATASKAAPAAAGIRFVVTSPLPPSAAPASIPLSPLPPPPPPPPALPRILFSFWCCGASPPPPSSSDGGGQGICSRTSGHPLLEALSIFCMFAAVAAVKYAVQPQAPAVVFIISSADAELAVLVSPYCFWAGEAWGGKWGTESDSAMNSSSGPRGLGEDQ